MYLKDVVLLLVIIDGITISFSQGQNITITSPTISTSTPTTSTTTFIPGSGVPVSSSNIVISGIPSSNYVSQYNTLTCTANCNPAALSYKWLANGAQVSASSTLPLYTVAPGIYEFVCEAANEVNGYLYTASNSVSGVTVGAGAPTSVNGTSEVNDHLYTASNSMSGVTVGAGSIKPTWSLTISLLVVAVGFAALFVNNNNSLV